MADGGLTWAEVAAARKPVTASARVCIRPDVVARIEALEAALATAHDEDERSNDHDRAPDLAREIVALVDEAKASEVEFVFESIGRKAWSDLIRSFPPSDEEREAGAEYGEYFAPAAVAASCVSPTGITADVAVGIYDEWNFAEFRKLWAAVLTANVGDASVPKAASAYAVLHGSGPNSRTAGLEESPGPSF